MKITQFADATAFLNHTRLFLEEREAEYNLMLGIADRISQNRSEQNLFFAVVESGQGEITMAALMTPPWQVVVTRGGEEELRLLTTTLQQGDWHVPGVHGPIDEAEQFARIWSTSTGQKIVEGNRLGIYQLGELSLPEFSEGKMRPAMPEDEELFVEWTEGFYRDADTNAPKEERLPRIRAFLGEGRLFFWEVDGTLVSMAGWHPAARSSARIGYVYTPPEFRRRGYAGLLTGMLSQHLLNSGKKNCFLFTDLANPTSNSIYQKIGYRQVTENREYRFVEGDA
ncbi:MAG: GNAT family N-acetyltransferase [Ignavibacteriae bacterium]|nr:GNAT family N-acetyltransferase [Ignavibacteriota bacterium]MCB9215978.1 GNAT family N-acetyltransferase [Ignavibacteria bacterium]